MNSTIQEYWRISPNKIHLLKFILEGYDGLATMSTVNAASDLVSLNIAPGCEQEVHMLIEKLGFCVPAERAV